jgi:DNA-binding NarL/FixJ family response regulator
MMDRTEDKMTTRVLLADDHMLFAQALSELLSERYEVVGVVGDGRALQTAARTHTPDVIVADVTMPLMNGLECVRSLRRDFYVPRIVFLTMHNDPELARECFKSGGGAFVTKERGFDELVFAIESVMADRFYLSPSIAADLSELLMKPSRDSFGTLTSRQREILQLLAEGKTVKEIALVTGLSTRTVEWHKYRMMRMLGLKHNAELVQYAMRIKLVV